MKKYLLHQTLENRGDLDICEEGGPYKCNWDNSWLGSGYYFWFHHIELAKYWGNARRYKQGYLVFKSECLDITNCWDLHADPVHQEEFMYYLKKMRECDLLEKDTTVAQIIEFIKNEDPDFKYEAIKILGVDSLSGVWATDAGMPRIKFEIPQSEHLKTKQRFLAYLDVIPPVQVCLFEKSSLKRTGYELVFPERFTKQNRTIDFLI